MKEITFLFQFLGLAARFAFLLSLILLQIKEHIKTNTAQKQKL